MKNEVKKSNEIIFVKFYITYELKRERTKHMKETEFKINKKKRNIIIAIVASIVVLAGIIRYLQLTIVDVKSGSPTKVLMKDRFVQCSIIGWIITFVLIIYA